MSADISEGSFYMEASLPNDDEHTTERTSWSVTLPKKPKLSAESHSNTSSQRLAKERNEGLPYHTSVQSLSDVTVDSQMDPGYSSHSSSSAAGYMPLNGQGDDTGLVEGSQDMGSLPGASNRDSGCPHGDMDLEDLIYHFHQFFQRQFEEELQLMHERVCDILASQEPHLRCIVHTALAGQLELQPSVPNACQTGNWTEHVHVHKPQPVSDDTMSSMITTTQMSEVSSKVVSTFQPAVPEKTTVSNNKQVDLNQADRHRDDILTLMTLSCQVSTLLAQPQFRA